jgi:hypothetical protein
MITENIKDPSLREWFLPGFSTSTPNDEVCAASMAMCGLQTYFEYGIAFFGIPQVTLFGTVDDWKLLRSKVDRLVEFDDKKKTLSTKWVPALRKIVDNFVLSAEYGSEQNLDFWDSVVFHNDTPPPGCSPEPPPPDFVTGWITSCIFLLWRGRGGRRKI